MEDCRGKKKVEYIEVFNFLGGVVEEDGVDIGIIESIFVKNIVCVHIYSFVFVFNFICAMRFILNFCQSNVINRKTEIRTAQSLV